MRPVDQSRRDLTAAVPGAQRGSRHARFRGGFLQRHPVGAIELRAELKFQLPVVEPVFPVHSCLSCLGSLCTQRGTVAPPSLRELTACPSFPAAASAAAASWAPLEPLTLLLAWY